MPDPIAFATSSPYRTDPLHTLDLLFQDAADADRPRRPRSLRLLRYGWGYDPLRDRAGIDLDDTGAPPRDRRAGAAGALSPPVADETRTPVRAGQPLGQPDGALPAAGDRPGHADADLRARSVRPGAGAGVGAPDGPVLRAAAGGPGELPPPLGHRPRAGEELSPDLSYDDWLTLHGLAQRAAVDPLDLTPYELDPEPLIRVARKAEPLLSRIAIIAVLALGCWIALGLARAWAEGRL